MNELTRYLAAAALLLGVACSSAPDSPAGDGLSKTDPTPPPPVAGTAPAGPVEADREPARPLQQLSWLEGTWRMPRPAGFVEETWVPAAGGAMLGVGRTITDGRMTSFEFLRIEERGDGLVYVAQPRGRGATDFQMADHSSDHVLFENPQHDFPKWVLYERTADRAIRATVGGDDGSLEFVYQRSR